MKCVNRLAKRGQIDDDGKSFLLQPRTFHLCKIRAGGLKGSTNGNEKCVCSEPFKWKTSVNDHERNLLVSNLIDAK